MFKPFEVKSVAIGFRGPTLLNSFYSYLWKAFFVITKDTLIFVQALKLKLKAKFKIKECLGFELV